ncbi:hypothetical protein HHO41_00715 [Bacillus sp. DNRA2]|uniref:hypothetical protein n=1 Tax=Bacillus sp. DNRA2 TaxID=2723053 RepID=UPI00145D02D0|nr:hypothetical protein [Bacillus sp. DNRA2]NMD68789.1 hypothetical protein [Bacillus sp. DNRA2]
MRRRKSPLLLIAIAITVIGIAVASLVASSKNKPEHLVEQFYKLEQEGDFGSSWDLFHSQMKERFNKDQYIQSRAHVFMQDMDAHSFTFELGDTKKHHEWQATDGGKPLKNVHEVIVLQTFHSKFGHFTIEHPCYVVKEKGEWKLLWDYKQD